MIDNNKSLVKQILSLKVEGPEITFEALKLPSIETTICKVNRITGQKREYIKTVKNNMLHLRRIK
ncbi:hypothetical protein [Coprobacter tertius]|uniref:Uncharacterized protein n=1 Tax=Coprobacter tertius TaxID=2944915 RepID=A0ABT1MGF2_9BACT|nr:hypothetical protein [Coprobacter tertius]MCP9611718.1 hypothetical protein [Coprobacter tertius]